MRSHRSAVFVVHVALAVTLGGCERATGVAADPDAALPAETGNDGSTPCVPRTCAQLAAGCGTTPDGCGGVASCGDCPQGQTCGAVGVNQCGMGTCTPKSCVQLGASCGVVSDGCGQAMDCGGCAAPSTCAGGGISHQCGCTPRTCVQLGASCGTAPDGCGGVVDCGACHPSERCGGAGPNQCGSGICSPKTCAEQGASCGIISDQCSHVVDCGSCQSPDVCGGHGVVNQCGCLPKTCAQLGVSCGDVSNGCGHELHCGDCLDPRYECQPPGKCVFAGSTIVFRASASACPPGWDKLDYHTSFNTSDAGCSGGSVACTTIGNDSTCIHNCAGGGRVCVDKFTAPGCHDTTASTDMSIRDDSTAAAFHATCTGSGSVTLCQAQVEAVPSGWTLVALQTTPCANGLVASTYGAATAIGTCAAGCTWHFGSGCAGEVFGGGCANEHDIRSVHVSNTWTPSGDCTPDPATLRYVCAL